MARRTFIALVSGVLLVAPLAAEGQQHAGKIPKIGYLSGFSPEYDNTWLAAFRQGLQDIGYVQGKTILIEERHVSPGRDENLPQLAAQLVRLKVDLLVVAGTPAAQAAKTLTGAIPIVMTNAADPVGTGLVASLARPGGNITGLSDFNTAVVAKRLELLKELIPSAIRVAALLNPANPANPPQITLTQAAASALGVTILSFEAERANEIARAFVTMKRERSTGLIVIGDPTLGAHRKLILELAAKNRLPAVYSQSQWVSAGGLMSFGTNFADLYRRAATYVDKILKGAKPADLPVEQPTKFELVINLKTAKALGLTIPPSLLSRADEVIQ
jgi:putative ABC transport system substrate-binding protein